MHKCLLVVIGPSEVLTGLHSGLSRFSILNALDAERTLPRVENRREVLLCSEHKGPLRCHLSITALIESCPRVSLSWVEFLAACLLFLEAGASVCELFQVWSPPTQEPYNIF